jgi:hypothetical protein
MKPYKVFIRGFVLALLLGAVGATVWAVARSNKGIFISPEQRQILIKEHFTPVEVVKTIEVEVPVEVEKLITERVLVEVPPEVVEVIKEIHLPHRSCIPEAVEISGGAEILVAGSGRERLAQATWWAEARGEGWSASRGPLVVDEKEIVFEVTKASVPPRFRKDLWLGAGWLGSSAGPRAAFSLSGRKWSAMAGVGFYFDVADPAFVSEFESFVPNEGVETSVDFMIGRRF